MNPMKIIKTALSAAAVVFAFVLLSSFEARAENWIEVSRDEVWYNADYIFLDRGTGFVVVEVADYDGNTYGYFLDAFDCTGWIFSVLGAKDANGNYEVFPYWKTDERYSASIPQGSIMDQVAKQVCPIRNSLRYDDIPQ